MSETVFFVSLVTFVAQSVEDVGQVARREAGALHATVFVVVDGSAVAIVCFAGVGAGDWRWGSEGGGGCVVWGSEGCVEIVFDVAW